MAVPLAVVAAAANPDTALVSTVCTKLRPFIVPTLEAAKPAPTPDGPVNTNAVVSPSAVSPAAFPATPPVPEIATPPPPAPAVETADTTADESSANEEEELLAFWNLANIFSPRPALTLDTSANKTTKEQIAERAMENEKSEGKTENGVAIESLREARETRQHRARQIAEERRTVRRETSRRDVTSHVSSGSATVATRNNVGEAETSGHGDRTTDPRRQVTSECTNSVSANAQAASARTHKQRQRL